MKTNKRIQRKTGIIKLRKQKWKQKNLHGHFQIEHRNWVWDDIDMVGLRKPKERNATAIDKSSKRVTKTKYIINKIERVKYD